MSVKFGVRTGPKKLRKYGVSVKGAEKTTRYVHHTFVPMKGHSRNCIHCLRGPRAHK